MTAERIVSAEEFVDAFLRETPHANERPGLIARIRADRKAIVETAITIAATWQSATFPVGEPVDHETHEAICNQIPKNIADAIREALRSLLEEK